MPELIDPEVELYADVTTTKEDALLSEIAIFTKNSHPLAHMLSGNVQGAFLSMLSHLIQPLRILEIGTFTGYSALCLASGLMPNGILHTIELREDVANIAVQFFNKSLYRDKIILHRGNALEIIPRLNDEWDIVFIDADKTRYIDYYELTLPKLNPKGLIIADNVLFRGQAFEKSTKNKNALAIAQFNQHVAADRRVQQVLVTMRDGLLLIRKSS